MTGGGALGAAEGGGTAGNAVTLSGAATCAGSTFLGAWRTTGSSGALAGLSPPAVLAEADLARGRAGEASISPGRAGLAAAALLAGAGESSSTSGAVWDPEAWTSGAGDGVGSLFAPAVVADGSLDWIGSFFASTVVAGGSLR
jgi:hypothetical protein